MTRQVPCFIQKALALLLSCVSLGCGEAAAPNSHQAGSTDSPAAAAQAWADEEPPGPPASPDEAARVIDLRAFAPPDAERDKFQRSLVDMTYETKAAPVKAFEALRDKLVAEKWLELPGSYVTDQSASGVFGKQGFRLSVSVIPPYGDDQKNSTVTLHNHGNINPNKLPTPKDVQPFYGTPIVASYITQAPVGQMKDEVRKLFLDAGWEPYGEAGETQYFKRHAVKLSATVGAAPAQGGKTVITYSSEQLSADLPVPPKSDRVQYSDPQVSFDVPGTVVDVDKFYRDALGKRGWKATTDKPIEISIYQVLIFRNQPKDLIELKMKDLDDGRTRVLAEFQTAAQVEEMDRRLKAEAERMERERNKPKPKVAIALPADAADVEANEGRLEFTVGKGQAKATVEALRKDLSTDGWKEANATIDDMLGHVTLTKGDLSLSLTYVETGILPSEVTIDAIGAELVQGKAEAE